MMSRDTVVLRVLLVMFLVGLVPASGLLYIVSLDLAAAYPEVEHLRLPIFLAVLVGLAPVIVAVKVVFDFLGVVDQGEAFSPKTVRLLRRLKALVGITAAYLALGFAGVWVAAWVTLGQTQASMLLAWVAAEVVTLFLFTLVALLERLFTAALELRQDNEVMGSVPVPADWAGADWPSLRAAAWSAQAERHDDPSPG